LAQSHNNKDVDRRNPPEVMVDLGKISERLQQAEKRRRAASTGVLSIVVDGKEKTLLDPVKQRQTHFEISEDAELIEIRKKDDGLLLATHLITEDVFDDTQKPQNYHIRLEAGQEIQLRVVFLRDMATNEERTISIDVWYMETNLHRMGVLAWQRLIYHLSHSPQWFLQPAFPLHRVMSLVIIIVIGISLYFYLRTTTLPIKQEDLNTKTPKPTQEIVPPSVPLPTNPDTTQHTEIIQQPPIHKRPRKPRSKRNDQIASNATPPTERGDTKPVKNLWQVRNIYVDISVENEWGEELEREIKKRINESGKLKVVEVNQDFDAVLNYSSNRFSLKLNHKREDIVLGKESIKNKTAQEAAQDIIDDLLKKIEQGRAKAPPYPPL
jgi:hypothetical protein